MGKALRSMVGTGVAVVDAAVAGGRAGSGARSAWYAALDKPSFQPPGPGCFSAGTGWARPCWRPVCWR